MISLIYNMSEKVNNITIEKVNFILSQKIKEETKDDFLIKYRIKLIFKKEQNLNNIRFHTISNEARILLIKLIDLLYILFKKSKEEREK